MASADIFCFVAGGGDEIKIKQEQSKTHGSSSRTISTTVESPPKTQASPPKTQVRMASRLHSQMMAP
jgi:hypothetical protein